MTRLKLIKALARPLYVGIQNRIEHYYWTRYYTPAPANLDADCHLREAVAWLCRAQDAGSDRGISYGAYLGGGFEVSYPETTGYIIPTFLALADHYDDPRLFQRAVEMGDWEIAIQMPEGAVMGGKFNTDPKPAVFNTGQVLLGWSALYRTTRAPRFKKAARRAVEWLLSMQEPDGTWIRGNSQFARADSTVYNVKAAWGMCEAGLVCDWKDAVAGAVRNAEFCLTRQHGNGWFADCCLTSPEEPLLHTIAYSMQGLLGIGTLMNRQDFIAAARKTCDALCAVMRPDGFLAGRFNRLFEGTVMWCCLTGSAQTSWVCSQLYQSTGEEKYRQAVQNINRYLSARHDVSNANLAIRGGVAGSWPVSGDYGKFKILNWATKFYVDALLTEKRIYAINGAATA